MPTNNEIIAVLEGNRDITAVLYPAQGIRAEFEKLYIYNPDAGGASVHHDDTLKGSGTISDPLGISDEVMEEIENAGKIDDVRVDGVSVVTDKIAEIDLTGKVDKTSEVDKVYGTDAQGNQTTYDVDGFGKVDDVLVNGTSVVTNGVANVTVPTKTSDITNDSGFITKDVNDLTNYTKTEDLADVALTGDYGDLENTPTNVSDFTNDANYQNATQVQDAIDVATENMVEEGDNVSVLNNDANYQNATQVSNTVSGAINTHNTSNNAHSNLLTPITQDIDDIEALIPAQASEENKLADKNFVNSSVATNTAYFIGTFNSVEELEAYSGTLTNNDYAFVVGTDAAGNTVYDRYKYNADTQQWIFEYELNNSSFTAGQWAAINSGATSEAIAQIAINTGTISEHIADKNNPHEVTKAQVGLGNVDNTSDLNKPISTATQEALDDKQDIIDDLATIRSGASLGATSLQPGDNVSELTNDAGYTTNVGTVTSVNNTQPDANGNVNITTTGAAWGSITGTLSDQTDLQEELDKRILQDDSLTLFPVGEEEEHVGEIRQYIGQDYPLNKKFHGYFYQWTKTQLRPGRYSYGWEQWNVQPQGGGAVSDLTDVTLTDLSNGQVLVYNSSTNKWVNDDQHGGVTITYNSETEELTIS